MKLDRAQPEEVSGEAEDRATTLHLTSRLRESGGKEGVYYVARFPTRWRPYAFAWEDFGDLWHGEAWRRYLAGDLAEAWAARLQTSVAALRAALEPWWKGFPRGRVERVGIQEYAIFHANDLAETGVTRERVQNAFELANRKVAWSLDPHEQQNPEHQAALASLLPFP
jgi:hypothetical protein